MILVFLSIHLFPHFLLIIQPILRGWFSPIKGRAFFHSSTRVESSQFQTCDWLFLAFSVFDIFQGENFVHGDGIFSDIDCSISSSFRCSCRVSSIFIFDWSNSFSLIIDLVLKHQQQQRQQLQHDIFVLLKKRSQRMIIVPIQLHSISLLNKWKMTQHGNLISMYVATFFPIRSNHYFH